MIELLLQLLEIETIGLIATMLLSTFPFSEEKQHVIETENEAKIIETKRFTRIIFSPKHMDIKRRRHINIIYT